MLMNYELRPAEILLVEDNLGDVRLIEEALKDSKLLNNLNVVSDGIYAMDFLHQRNKEMVMKIHQHPI